MGETYRINPPKHISIGDPWYYEMYQGEELIVLTVYDRMRRTAANN